jgi:hypothetical protein
MMGSRRWPTRGNRENGVQESDDKPVRWLVPGGERRKKRKRLFFSVLHSWSTVNFPEHYDHILCERVSFHPTLSLREDCWKIFGLLCSTWLSPIPSSRVRGHRGSNFQWNFTLTSWWLFFEGDQSWNQ